MPHAQRRGVGVAAAGVKRAGRREIEAPHPTRTRTRLGVLVLESCRPASNARGV